MLRRTPVHLTPSWRLLIILLMVGAIAPARVSAGGHSWIVGIATGCAPITAWYYAPWWGWHSDESGYDAPALDLGDCNYPTAGKPVYYQDYGYYGDDMLVGFYNHQVTIPGDPHFTNCTGVNAELYDYPTGWYLGSAIHYVHIDPTSIFGTWIASRTGWNFRYLGTVSEFQPGCPFSGPHLHQSAVNKPGMNFHGCYNCQQLPNPINPTGNVDYYWLHTFDHGAFISSPWPGTTLPGSSVTFTRTNGTGVVAYSLYVGTCPGCYNIFAGYMSSPSQLVTGIPTNGSPIFVRLWSWLNPIGWVYNDFLYTAATIQIKADITQPPPFTTLHGPGVVFTCNDGSGVVSYSLWVGTCQGCYGIFAGYMSSPQQYVAGLPANNSTIWVRLWSYFNGIGWQYNEYTYLSAP